MRILLSLLLLLLLSCNKNEKIESPSTFVDTLAVNSFEYKYKNEPKYFLKFWKNITIEDFYSIKAQMKKDGIIDLSNDRYGTKYDIKIGKSIINFEPILEKDIVIGIRLPEISEEIYNLYTEKYNLPKLVEISTVGICYKERNPCFHKEDCPDFLKIGNDISEVPLSEVEQYTNFNKKEYIVKGLPEDVIEIKNDKCNIEVRNPFAVGGYDLISKFRDTKHTINSIYYPNNEYKFEHIRYKEHCTTQYRYIVTRNIRSIDILYFPNDYFERKSNKEKSEKVKIDKLKKENSKKAKDLLDKI